ncbi:hypothetical protein [Leptospira licerasiae]|uniref:hypothetical protein n=1 Tax=Leptospira licerasiae TaxID=447106 RepID=UPI00301B21B3
MNENDYKIDKFSKDNSDYILYYKYSDDSHSESKILEIYVSRLGEKVDNPNNYFAHFYLIGNEYIQPAKINANNLKRLKLTTYIFNFAVQFTGRKLRSSRTSANCPTHNFGDDYLLPEGINLWENYVSHKKAINDGCHYIWLGNE